MKKEMIEALEEQLKIVNKIVAIKAANPHVLEYLKYVERATKLEEELVKQKQKESEENKKPEPFVLPEPEIVVLKEDKNPNNSNNQVNQIKPTKGKCDHPLFYYNFTIDNNPNSKTVMATCLKCNHRTIGRYSDLYHRLVVGDNLYDKLERCVVGFSDVQADYLELLKTTDIEDANEILKEKYKNDNIKNIKRLVK